MNECHFSRTDPSTSTTPLRPLHGYTGKFPEGGLACSPSGEVVVEPFLTGSGSLVSRPEHITGSEYGWKQEEIGIVGRDLRASY